MSAAAKKLQPNAARARLSEILERMELLASEFDQLSLPAGVSEEPVNTLHHAVSDARAMIGDMLEGTDENGFDLWTIAGLPPCTRAQLDERMSSLSVAERRAS